MTNQEFNNEFDVLYNNIMSNQAPGLDEYEKSVFLTKAQDEILKAYFDPTLNRPKSGFDGSERRQIDFSRLVKVATPAVTAGVGNIDTRTSGVAKVSLPTDALMILNEVVKVTRNTIKNVALQVVPIAYNEYSRLMSKPYKRPLKWQAWRLQTMDGGISKADLIANNSDTITGYEVRYLKRPVPIILTDLEGVSIGAGTPVYVYTEADSFNEGTDYYDLNHNLQEGITADNFDATKPHLTRSTSGTPSTGTEATQCELDPILHQEILQRAVELAKAAYTGELQAQVALGKTSQTDIGQ